MFVLVFGLGESVEREPASSFEVFRYIQFSGETLATEFQIPEGLPVGLEQLAATDLLKWVQEQERNRFLDASRLQRVQGTVVHSAACNPNPITSFLETTGGEVLAGSFDRLGNKAIAWWLPTDEIDVVAWVKEALSQWHRLDPKRFPIDFGWRSDSQWFTARERKLVEDLRAVSEEKEALLSALAEREHAISAELTAAKEAADKLERALLTEQGDALVDAVAAALRVIGFAVQRMDEVQPEDDLLEDLRVSCPELPEWVALVEVRGYRGGAQVKDLMRMQRFVKRYRVAMGKDPSQCWYVVNQFLGQSPASRAAPLSGNPDEVAEFAKDSGLVIDTRELFKMWTAVEAGASKEIARAHLCSSLGTYATKALGA